MKYGFDVLPERRGTDSIKWSAFPADVLPMWVADSDFACAGAIIDAVNARVAHGVFGYPHLGEVVEEGVLHWLNTRFGWQGPKGAVAFAPGVCGAIALALRTFTRPGDQVLTLTPSYPPLLNLPGLNGRVSVTSDLVREGDAYRVDFADLEEKLSRSRTTMLLLCNPHNPSGKVFTREELQQIGELCLKHKVLVFSDEIHCDYVFEGKHITFPSLGGEAAQNCLVAINPSKTFNIAGFFTAAVASPNLGLISRFKDTLAASSLEPSITGATALHTAYTRCADYADEVCEYTRQNVRFAVDYITKNIPAIKSYMPQATYLLWLDCNALGLGDKELMELFLRQAKVALNPGPNYGAPGKGFMRLNCACPRATLTEGLERIAAAVNGK